MAGLLAFHSISRTRTVHIEYISLALKSLAEEQQSQLKIRMRDENIQGMVPLVPTEKLRIAQAKGWRENIDDDDHAVLALRNFIFDICNQNGGGHGGSAIGMAAIGVALYKYTMRYNPSNPEWFDRDRFVLSNGMRYESPVW